MKSSLNHRYTLYSIVFCIGIFSFFCWLFLVGLAPKEPLSQGKTVVSLVESKQTPEDISHSAKDPFKLVKFAAQEKSLETRLAIGVAKSETLLSSTSEINENFCQIANDVVSCVHKLADTYNTLSELLNRKPTPSDLLLAHIFGVDETLRISQLPGNANIDGLGEKIIKANQNLKGFASVRDFRIWLSRAVYRNMY